MYVCDYNKVGEACAALSRLTPKSVSRKRQRCFQNKTHKFYIHVTVQRNKFLCNKTK